jgi:hypothetical protein
MTKHSGGSTINQGSSPKPTQDERDAEYDDITGNVATRGEKPSPATRDRGEATSRTSGGALDIDRD